MTTTRTREKHGIVDSWHDVVIVCSCGWRTTERTVLVARTEWQKHRLSHTPKTLDPAHAVQ